MQTTSLHSLAFAAKTRKSMQPMLPMPPMPQLSFGFPRAWLPRQLCATLAAQLYVGSDACQYGTRDDMGRFVALTEDDDFDGPDFVLRLSYAIGGHPVFDHEVDLQVSILCNHYQLQAAGRQFDIAFLPAADSVRLAAAARWILGSIDRLAQAG